MDFRPSLASQKGSALIFAVGLCTLVVILATSMILGLHHDMRRFERLNDTVSELAAARSATSWALSILADEKVIQKTEQTYAVTLNGVEVQASLIDVDGLFNVNTLMEEPSDDIYSAQAVFNRLAKAVGMSESVVAAMDHSGSALVYLSQMKTVFGLPQEMFSAFVPYVRVSAEGSRTMNINTMPPVVLAALLDVELETAVAILTMAPFESEVDFHEALIDLSIEVPPAGLSQWLKYSSQQYLVHAQIKAKGQTEIYTLLAPEEKKWRVVYQSTGVRI